MLHQAQVSLILKHTNSCRFFFQCLHVHVANRCDRSCVDGRRAHAYTARCAACSKSVEINGIHKNAENLMSFGIMFGEKFFGITDLLSSSLQGCDAKAASDTVCEKVVEMREDTEFDTFWERATTTAEELQLSDPTVPTVCKPPR